MKIILCGGGTGGHITPILAVAHEIKKQIPESEVIYVGEHGGKFGHLVKNQTSINSIETIFAGKFRRYYGESWLIRVVDIKTNLLNLRDFFYVFIGFLQSLLLIKRLKPDAVLLKGGYVGLPFGMAAAILKIPYITHDSDAIPSLTNKIVGKWARWNSTGAAGGMYSYPREKIKFVGVPVGPEYQKVTESLKAQYREELKIPETARMILITGGSLGATKINQSVDRIIKKLIDKFSDLYVVIQAGKGNLKDFSDLSDNSHASVFDFLPNLYRYSGAADIVVTRGGANSIAELSLQAKTCVVIPNPYLAAGHQTKNAEMLATKDAAKIVYQEVLLERPDLLYDSLVELLNNRAMCQKLADNISSLSIPDAAGRIASLLTSISK